MLVPPEASLLGDSTAILSLSPHKVVPLCVSVLMSSYKDTRHTGLRPTLVTSFYLNYLFKTRVQIQLLGRLGVSVG